MTREVMQQALEALYENTQYSMRGDPIAYQDQRNDDIIEAIKEALAQPDTDMSYTIALQRAIEWHCDGKAVPLSAAELCPYHAEKLNQALAQQDAEAHLQAVADFGQLQAQPEQDQTEIAFEAWWQAHGQYCRAGGGDYEKTFAYRAWMASLAIPEKPKHPEQLARLGWQYVECPACGSEGARAFPKPEEQQSCDKQEPVAVVTGQYDFPMMQWRSVKHQMSTAIGSLLYASPPQRQPLTDEVAMKLLAALLNILECDEDDHIPSDLAEEARAAIEAAHGIGGGS